MRKIIAAAALAVTGMSGISFGQTTFDNTTSGYQSSLSNIATGLAGNVYNISQDGSKTPTNIASAIASEGNPSVTLTTVNLGTGFNGNDTTATSTFVGASSTGSVTTDSTILSNSNFDMAGYLHIATPGTYHLTTNSDDGSAIYIGGETTPGAAQTTGTQVVNNDGNHAGQSVTSAALTFNAAGYYPIEIEYYNAQYVNNGAINSGGATFQATSTDLPNGLDANLVTGQVPEPASLGLIGLGLFGLAARRRA